MAEQKAKVLVAGSVVLFVAGLVVLLLFVIPAARRGQVASAQEMRSAQDGISAEDEAMMEKAMAGSAAEGTGPEGITYEEDIPLEDVGGAAGTAVPGAAVPGGAVPGAAAAEGVVALPAAEAITGEPLEASRPNPFAPRAAVGRVAEAARAIRYGPDWSKLPIAERVAFVRPEVPERPTPPPPVIRPPEILRVTSIMWGAEGQALAAYELAEGGSGVLKPGDRIQGWTVTEIRRSGVTLRDIESGETQRVELRSRREKKEPVLAPGQPGGVRRLPQVPMQPH